MELQEKAGGNTKSEEVNKFEGNVEKKKGRGTTMIMPDYKNEKGENLEFNIEKNGYGVEIYNFKKYGEKYMVLRNPTGI